MFQARSQLWAALKVTVAPLAGVLLLAACDPPNPDGTPSEPDDTPSEPGEAGALAFVAPPGRAEGQVAFTPALEIEARDRDGKRDTAFTGSVTISLKANPGAATLGGTLTRPAENGVARFDDLSIDIPATGYTLLATSGSMSVESGPFDVGLTMATVTSGSDFTCGVTRAGKGYCWGRNAASQHGSGKEGGTSQTPMPIAGGHDFVTLSAGHGQTCGVTKAGKAYCWGEGLDGQLGIGAAPASEATPKPVAGDLTFSTVSAGFRFSCGLTTEGQGYCWGFGEDGQLGTGGTDSSLVPVPVTGGHELGSLDVGDSHACGVTKQGRAYCWGWPTGLGDGTREYRHAPTAVSGSLTFAAVRAGNHGYSCGLTTAGEAHCWGTGAALGNGSLGEQLTPSPVSGGLTFASIEAGGHTCAVTTSGEGYCWGTNQHGEIGHGGTADALVPAAVEGDLTFTSISPGYTHTCGVTTSGEAYCWGTNANGQLGNGAFDADPHPTPSLVFGTKQ